MSANHGNTPAAWTGVTIVLIAFLVGGLGLVFESWTVFWVGVALLPLGMLVGYLMGKLTGLGHDPERDPMHGGANGTREDNRQDVDPDTGRQSTRGSGHAASRR